MGSKLHIALLQSPLYWEDPGANRKMFGEKISKLPAGVDLVVLPEMFTTGFTMAPGHIHPREGPKTLEWMKGLADKGNWALVGSVALVEGGDYFNRLFFVHPGGKVDVYDKRHCFTLAGEGKVYRAGTEKIIVDYRGFKICPLICYDLRFPVWARNVEGYDALIYVANWPAPRIAAWDSLLRARAIENMAYCIGVNRIGGDALGHQYPGHSAVYDMLGHPLAHSEREEVLYAVLERGPLEKTREGLRFLEDRDSFNLTL